MLPTALPSYFLPVWSIVVLHKLPWNGKVEQQVKGATVTSTELAGNTITISAGAGEVNIVTTPFSGTTGNSIFAPGPGADAVSMTLSFAFPVNIVSVYHADPTGFGETLTFTPTGGSNSVVMSSHSANSGNTAILNWTNVSSFTITGAASAGQYAIDEIIVETAPLPVQLTTFEANVLGNSVSLNWQTEVELNNEMFLVEQSLDGRTFNEIGQVAGKGTTIEPQSYRFEVENPRNGIAYYRLKQIDFDGQFEYSPIISVQFKGNNTEIGDFYPNPSPLGFVNLMINAQDDQEIEISVIDLTGKLVMNQVHSISNGDSRMDLDFSSLDPGMYMIRIGNDSNATYRKLIIQQ